MKFTMYEKETKDSKYRDTPTVPAILISTTNGKRFHILRSAPVKGNQFGRTEEYYQCEGCAGCPHREKCHKSKENRVVRVNEKLTKCHNEVLNNPNCVHGALLRMNRSIQAEGAFDGIKWNKGYKRLQRRGIEGELLELGLISRDSPLFVGCFFTAPFLLYYDLECILCCGVQERRGRAWIEKNVRRRRE